MAELAFHPLTPERWPDLVRLFGAAGETGVGGGCWCMFWRLASRKQYERQKGEANRRAMRSLVEGGGVPGLLAYDAEVPVGWCAVAPRPEYPALERSPSRRAIDSEEVWSIPCVYVARSHRRRGVAKELVQAAVRHVASQGGRLVEAYPVPAKPGVTSTSYAFTGFASTFEAAGFVECARRSPTRPILRYRIEPGSQTLGRSGGCE